MAGMLGVGLSGLNAAQAGLLTTSHNISNANTAGFSRQTASFTTNTPQFTGAGFIGSGSRVAAVRREYDQFLNQQVMNAATRSEYFATYEAAISQVENLLGDESAGLSSAMAEFFRGVNDVANNPANIAARQAMISAGELLAGRFQSMNTRLNEIRDLNEGQIAGSVTDINAYARQIAVLNERIAQMQLAGPSVQANDLHDQRDQLLAELNQVVKVSTFVQSDGALNVFIGSGQSLVVGSTASALTVAAPDPADPFRNGIFLQTSAQIVEVPESQLGGGRLGALLNFRSQTLDGAQEHLGRIALELATQFNAVHEAGVDLDGNTGNRFFADLSALVFVPADPNDPAQLLRERQDLRRVAGAFAVAITDPRDIAAASRDGVASATNTGSAVVRLTGNGGSVFTMRFDQVAGGYNVFDQNGVLQGLVAYDPLTDAGGVTRGLPGSLAAISVDLSGIPADGDAFSSPGVGDNRNMLTLGGMQTSKLMNGGTATFQTSYAQLVGSVGNKAREVQVAAKAQLAQLQQATAARDALSGVNLDEEAANLIRFQQAYQAAAKVMSLAGSLFDEVLSIARA